MNWALVMVSCVERRADRKATLIALRETDWYGEPQVLEDDGEGRTTIERITRTWGRALDAAANVGLVDYVLCCEDDVRFVRRLRHALEAWSVLTPVREHFIGSLYNNGDAIHTRAFGGDTRVGPLEFFWGAQALVLCPGTAHVLAEGWRRGRAEMPESRMAEILSPFMMMAYHVPSLVQHVGRSTWMPLRRTFPHEAKDFNASWTP
jgi:hypothetical protein